jgi:large subunit ribosomal protein L5
MAKTTDKDTQKKSAKPKADAQAVEMTAESANPVEEPASKKASKKAAKPAAKAGPPRLKELYKAEIAPGLMGALGTDNIWEVPRLEKIVVNMGVGEASLNSKALDSAMVDMSIITGQKPTITRAKKSIAGFKIRQGMAIGCKVTMRGDRMWEFFDRLMATALPRIRDFRGLPATAFDGRGNYTLGVDEQLIFPEIDYDQIEKVRGMDITIVTTAKNDDSAYELLRAFGFPLRARGGAAA